MNEVFVHFFTVPVNFIKNAFSGIYFICCKQGLLKPHDNFLRSIRNLQPVLDKVKENPVCLPFVCDAFFAESFRKIAARKDTLQAVKLPSFVSYVCNPF